MRFNYHVDHAALTAATAEMPLLRVQEMGQIMNKWKFFKKIDLPLYDKRNVFHLDGVLQ